ncbi:MAG: hypothetical protein R2909_17625 [Gemmatimonadales bacterium]
MARPTPLHPSLPIVLLLAACGGESTSTTPPPPPPPPGNTRIVSVEAGNGQSARVGEAVPVPPAVKVTDGSGTPVSGIQVSFAITSGGGSVSGATPTTGADGVAAVGAWVLGAVGQNTLAATVSGATSGSPAGFSATGQEVLIQPTADTSLSGVVTVTRLVVPEGVTVDVADSLVLLADSTIEIRGTVRGACVTVRLQSERELLVHGTVDNGCAAGDSAAGLTLVGKDGYAIDSASLQSSGDVVVTNDPTLGDGDFLPAPRTAPAAGAGARADRLRLGTVNMRPFPLKAAKGVDRPRVASPGADGRSWRFDCRGTLRIQGGVDFRGQHGGDGGKGTHTPAVIDAFAQGGAGGRGGRMIVRATQRVTFDGILNEIRSGDGGRGGDAMAQSSPTGNGTAGPIAEAIGGAGGEPGLFAILAPAIDFDDAVDLVVGSAGHGGDAIAVGADGLDAQGTSRAQAGGPALATGGIGGGTPDDTLAARGGVAITNPGNALVSGGRAGSGGHADATGGLGGTGSDIRPDGGRGGATEAAGGLGGTALLRDHHGQLFGPGGDGGSATLRGAKGGAGWSRCSLPNGLLPGGAGGAGGALKGVHGAAGAGLSAGSDGLITLNQAGNGGNGANGEPRGLFGQGGSQDMSKPPQTIGSNSASGQSGFDCVKPNALAFDFTVTGSSGLDPMTPCEKQAGAFDLVSFSPDPVSYQIVVNGVPSFATLPTSGLTPPAPGLTTPWTTTPVLFFDDLCSMVTSGPTITGDITVNFTLGPTTVSKVIPVRYDFLP